ncbi:Cysteine sulfinic acid decarboxylase [Cricetulus griseus]|uniref:Cysteine sulfinic acid decarboxylase n=1 Tax=Cricetulus griseus TaxID=10029 RepID=G3IKL7_CRIGR|nr:Cysteine sulfinic acid decarboxylase [Cricetulus griseus]
MIDRGLEGGQAWESFLTAGEGVGPLLGVWREEGSARQLEEKPLTQLCFVSPRADSVAWNPHKLLGAGLQCSALLLRDTSNLLKRCHGSQASYLFQQDKFYDVALDTGDKVVQCGRRVDCLKLWLMWKAQGGQGLERRIDQAFALTRYLVEEIKKREGFELVMEVAPVLKERMVKKGSMMIGYQPHGTRANFFRMVVANPTLTQADIDFLLCELERLGQDL